MQDLNANKIKLDELKVRLENYIGERACNNYVYELYGGDINENWLVAQCKSACNQIEKINNKKSDFNISYQEILTEHDLVLITKELISDISLLDQLSGRSLGLDYEVSRNSYISSNQFFLHAKFSYFTKKIISETTNRNFSFSTMPTLIRQAIEIRLKNMIGLKRVEKKDGGFNFISISRLLDFFLNETQFIDFPVCLRLLKSINEWTNTFVHTGVAPFCWQSLEAIDLIENLFSIKDTRSNSLSIHGYTYFKRGKSISDLKLALDEYFKANFIFSENGVEGCIIHSK